MTIRKKTFFFAPVTSPILSHPIEFEEDPVDDDHEEGEGKERERKWEIGWGEGGWGFMQDT